MPELPEIEIICRGLRSKILNETILEAKRLTNLKLRQAIPLDLECILKNKKIIDISRRAKYINIHLNDSITLIIHLGMSGKLLIKDKSYDYQKHDHFSFDLSNGDVAVYNDPRRFGLITLCDTNDLASHPLFRNLGIEPLSEAFTSSYLEILMHTKKQAVKVAIMDNSNIVGVGNIYASESLFLSKIDPERIAGSLKRREIKSLRDKIVYVLEEAIKRGGSSIKDYASVGGELGYFQNYFNVYGREGKQCTICNDLIEAKKQAGRRSFYCPACQK